VTPPQTRRLVTGEGAEVAGRVEIAASAWKRFLGLMGRTELPRGHGLYLRPCSSIHMFFMRFPLDVAFIDKEGRVLRAYHGLRPWRMSRVVFGAEAAVELPAGTLAGFGVDTGTLLQLV
jgi:uncharacterized membrane protein (UPF0127 family)